MTEEDQLEWYGLVESKVRHLITNLEREAIELAHVWPKTYPSLEPGKEKTCCYWFVGLVIKQPSQSEGSSQQQSLDLTTPIKKFTELVMGTAITIKRWKEGMKVEADYKKRKQLASYLPPAERHKLKTERKSNAPASASSTSSLPAGEQQAAGAEGDATSSTKVTPAASTSAAATTATAAKRRPSDSDDVSNGSGGGGSKEEEMEQPPPMKRSNTNDSEMSNGLQVS